MNTLGFLTLTLLVIALQRHKGLVESGKPRVYQTRSQNEWIDSVKRFQSQGDPCKFLDDLSPSKRKTDADTFCITAMHGYNHLPEWARPSNCRNARDAACYRKTSKKFRCAFIVDGPPKQNPVLKCVLGSAASSSSSSSSSSASPSERVMRLKNCIKHLDLNPPTW